MGKYDVQIDVKARDAVGPGLDSAKQKITKWGSSVEDLAGRYVKFGGIEAGFKGLTGVMSLLKGNTEEAVQAFERLPFGIGPAVAAARELWNTLTGVNENLDDLIKLREKVAAGIGRGQDRRAFAAITDPVEREVASLRKEIDAEIAARQKELEEVRKSESSSEEGRKQFEVAEKLKAELIALEQEFRDREKQIRDDAFQKLVERDRKNAEAWQADRKAMFDAAIEQQKRYIATTSQVQIDGLAEWDAAVDEMNKRAEQEAKSRQERLGSLADFLANQQRDPERRASLAAGTQSRFLTGAADVARDRIASEQLNEQKASKELLGKAVSLLDTIARSPWGVQVGIF